VTWKRPGRVIPHTKGQGIHSPQWPRRAKRQHEANERKSEKDRKQARMATARAKDPLALEGARDDEEDGQIFDGILHQAKVRPASLNRAGRGVSKAACVCSRAPCDRRGASGRAIDPAKLTEGKARPPWPWPWSLFREARTA
jgi:hypothetical protein